MNEFLDNVVAKLPKGVQPYAKAFIPAVLSVALAAQDLVFTGPEINTVKVAAISGLTASAIAFLFPNKG